MASYEIPNGHVGAHEKTLVANTVDTVTFATGSTGTPGWARMPKEVEILTDGDADIYVTIDGTAPTVMGTACYRVPAMPGSTVIDINDATVVPVVVKLISSGTPTYSVSRA